ncbi:gastrula zinc finger protein xFG20-1-like isoform X2 [Ischnura elegans]|nr:gastrula zinc finger protein xFG20-1-like isoform X2 [Ischnura elegans]
MDNSPYESFVLEAVNNLLNYQIVKNGRLPWLICHSCLVRLSDFREFKIRCARSKLVFDSIVQPSKDEICYPVSKCRRKKENLPHKGEGFNEKCDAEVTLCPCSCCVLEQIVSENDADKSGEEHSLSFGVGSGLDNCVENCEIESSLDYCVCEMCKTEFFSFRELKMHIKLCHTIMDHQGDDFPERQSRQCVEEEKKMAAALPSLDPSLNCARCGRTFKSKESLIFHIEKFDFKCTRKGKGENYKERNKLSDHKTLPHNKCNLSDNSPLGIYFEKINQFSDSSNFYHAFSRSAEIQEENNCQQHSSHDLGCESKSKQSPSAIDNENSSAAHQLDPRFSGLLSCVSAFKQKIPPEETNYLNEMDYSSTTVSTSVAVTSLVQKDILSSPIGHDVHNNLDLKNVSGMVKLSTFEGENPISEEPLLKNVMKSPNHNLQASQSSETKFRSPSTSCLNAGTVFYICDYCGKSFTEKPELRGHIVKCHLPLGLERCPICYKLFLEKCELERHLRVHPKEKKYFCTICELNFQFKSGLKRHIKSAHDVSMAYLCGLCFNGFGSRADLGLHQSLVHQESEKRFRCDNCGKAYTKKYTYNLHVEVCQLKTKTFECRTCGKQLSTRSSLSNHYKSHSTIKTYQCSMCPKQFSHSSNRNIHLKDIHMKLRPHKCGICSKQFATKARLRLHYCSHSDDRPFKCSDCPKAFKERKKLRMHQQKVH